MKKYRIYLLILVLLLTGCGGKDGEQPAVQDTTAFTEETAADWRLSYKEGLALAEAKDWEGAVAALTAAIEIAPDQAQPLEARGAIHARIWWEEESLNKALADYTEAWALDGERVLSIRYDAEGNELLRQEMGL